MVSSLDFSLRLGPLRLRLPATRDWPELCPAGDPHERFLTRADEREPFDSPARLELPVRLGRARPAEGFSPQSCYQHRGGWQLRRDAVEPERYWGLLPIPPGGEAWQRLFALDRESGVELCLPSGCTRPAEPLAYLFSEILWLATAAWHGGALLHAAAVDYRGRGLLFLGASGSGKSTTAALWTAAGAGVVLADESVMLWRARDQLLLGGTPWPGSAGVGQARIVPLAAVFILEHAPRHQVAPLPPAAAAGHCLGHAFLPHWSEAGAAAALELAEAVVQSVPAWRFGFRPEPEAVAFIRELVENR